MSNILVVSALHKTFAEGKIKTPVLHGIDFVAAEGETIAILGASGSGKSTFLQIIGGLQNFDSGAIHFRDQAYAKLNDTQLTALREAQFGFVYQFHHLLPELTALENVMLPLMIRKLAKSAAAAAATAILEQVGLAHRIQHKPSELSGGERQRVALARALVKKPRILFADEPTGNLDRHAATKVMDCVFSLSETHQTTLIFITHDERLAQRAARVLKIEDGFLTDY